MSLERNIIKLNKKKNKIELKIKKLKEIAKSLRKDIEVYENQIIKLEQSDLFELRNISDLDSNILLMHLTKEILENVEDKIAKKTYEYVLVDKKLDNFESVKEKII